LFTIEGDNNVHVIVAALEVLHDFCTQLGPASVDQKLESITETMIILLKNETQAQDIAFEGEEEVHGELFESTTLLLDALIKCCGEGFLPYFDKLYPELKRFTTSDTAEDDVAEIIGCFAQAIKYMPSAAEIYGLDMLEICFNALEYGDEYVNRNMTFCVGLIVEHGKQKIGAHCKTIMEKLRVIYETATLPDTKDNAIAAIGRMVYTHPSEVPLNMVRLEVNYSGLTIFTSRLFLLSLMKCHLRVILKKKELWLKCWSSCSKQVKTSEVKYS